MKLTLQDVANFINNSGITEVELLEDGKTLRECGPEGESYIIFECDGGWQVKPEESAFKGIVVHNHKELIHFFE